MKRVCRLWIFPFLLIVFSCCREGKYDRLANKHFKITVPFILDGTGILIPTRWGREQQLINLHFDNHSPTWINQKLVNSRRSFHHSKDFSFRTRTADGTRIAGDVIVCDSVSIGGIAFINVLLYDIQQKSNGTSSYAPGVFGVNLISQGVWKIDFENQQLSFASSPKQIGSIEGYTQIPCSFSEGDILLNVLFSDGMSQTLDVDLGYNGSVLVPPSVMKALKPTPKNSSDDSVVFTTPASSSVIQLKNIADSIQIGNEKTMMIISSSVKVKESLVGLAFFARYKCLVLDYVNGRLYILK